MRMRPTRGPDLFPPWERILWFRSTPGGPLACRAACCYLTDLRLVRIVGRTRDSRVEERDELALDQVRTLALRRTPLQRLGGRADLVIGGIRPDGGFVALVFGSLRRADLLAVVEEVLARGGPGIGVDPDLVDWTLRPGARRGPRWMAAAAALGCLLAATLFSVVALGSRDVDLRIEYPADDAIYPGGVKRSRVEIETFMEDEVMPFARDVLGPLVGGRDQVTCETCHGLDGRNRGWRMPGVSALPYPRVRAGSLERYADPTDPQLRNAVYADLAQDDKQARAGYMRQVVMPGMARLLRRPAYDFTRSYQYNRSRAALGCYHCHQVR
jgi:hypothetical protein